MKTALCIRTCSMSDLQQEGDRAIIYFSGHGDVETQTMFQMGYLLTWDSPASPTSFPSKGNSGVVAGVFFHTTS